MKVKKIEEIEPKASRCISVNSNDKLFSIGTNGLLTHNSVSQRNVIIGCLLRPENWVLLGIDLKMVELSMFKDLGVKVAVDLETAVEFLRFAQAVMMKRYARMESAGVNDFEALPEKLQALMVMIDEAGELLSPSGAKALSESTVIQMANNTTKLLKDLQVGDAVLDNNCNPTIVTNKYEPIKQQKFKVRISKDNSNLSESFIAGEEHFWVVYFAPSKNENNQINLADREYRKQRNKLKLDCEEDSLIGPFIKTTSELKKFLDAESTKPTECRRKLKIKKGI